jgi:hypothetical protein
VWVRNCKGVYPCTIHSAESNQARFRIQHSIQRLFDGATHHLSKLILGPAFIYPDHFSQIQFRIAVNPTPFNHRKKNFF